MTQGQGGEQTRGTSGGCAIDKPYVLKVFTNEMSPGDSSAPKEHAQPCL